MWAIKKPYFYQWLETINVGIKREKTKRKRKEEIGRNIDRDIYRYKYI